MNRISLPFQALLSILVCITAVSAEPVQQAHSSAELLLGKLSADENYLEVGLHLIPDDEWHVYWKYPGDSGAAPILDWQLNNTSIKPELSWPIPKRLWLGSFVNYGYDSAVLLITRIPVNFNETVENIELSLSAEWLVCKEECIPGFADFTRTINKKHRPSEAVSERFRAFKDQLPVDLHPDTIRISSDTAKGTITVTVSEPLQNHQFAFIPATAGFIQNNARQVFNHSDTQTTITLQKDKNSSKDFRALTGLLIAEPQPDGKIIGYRVLQDTAPAQKPEQKLSFLSALCFAFIGGLILNLMPCVFPVLSIKILGFVQKAGKDTAHIRLHGLAFASGIILSFWLLVTVVLLLKSSGEQLGWGFQLQNPSFVALLVLLLTGLAANLFGAFEIGNSLQTFAGKQNSDNSSGYANSFFNGVLATLLATPCTAPFMAGAVAYGLSGTVIESFSVFTLLGLGLATPYLLLSFYPSWLTRLPRPGAWMNTFKQAMGFPLLLTALWLASVYAQQSSQTSLYLLLFSCILLSLFLWIYGILQSPLKNTLVRRLGLLLAVVGVALSVYVALPDENDAVESRAMQQDQFGEYSKDSYGLQWYEYSPGIVASLTESAPVYVDFTASWCVTCQFNKQLVFSSATVRREMELRGVQLVRADWTNKNPIITEALAQFGKAGVPLNVLYWPQSTREPVVFPSLLSPGIVLEELNKLPVVKDQQMEKLL